MKTLTKIHMPWDWRTYPAWRSGAADCWWPGGPAGQRRPSGAGTWRPGRRRACPRWLRRPDPAPSGTRPSAGSGDRPVGGTAAPPHGDCGARRRQRCQIRCHEQSMCSHYTRPMCHFACLGKESQWHLPVGVDPIQFFWPQSVLWKSLVLLGGLRFNAWNLNCWQVILQKCLKARNANIKLGIQYHLHNSHWN